MKSKDFPGSNANFPARNINELPMRAHLSNNIRVTAWELTDEDIKNILESRTLYLMEIIPLPDVYSSIKVITINPVPIMHQLQFPTIIKNIHEKDTKKDA